MRRWIQNAAKETGFHLCGFTRDFLPRKKNYFLNWLNQNCHGTMQWLARNLDKRLAPNLLLDGCKSAILLAVSYSHEPPAQEYRLARYAHGEDYHIWMKRMLEELAQKIFKKAGEGFAWRSFVDTGPVLERDLSWKAGLGWIGKNTCLINENLGSYLFLGVIFTNLDLDLDQPLNKNPVAKKFDVPVNQCGSCRLCLEACPTQALTPYQLDATRCLSYHNIERRGPMKIEFAVKMGDRLVGCDICQEVCPWNQKSKEHAPAFWKHTFARHDLGGLDALSHISKSAYQQLTKNSAISRLKHKDFLRNVEIVKKNSSSN